MCSLSCPRFHVHNFHSTSMESRPHVDSPNAPFLIITASRGSKKSHGLPFVSIRPRLRGTAESAFHKERPRNRRRARFKVLSPFPPPSLRRSNQGAFGFPPSLHQCPKTVIEASLVYWVRIYYNFPCSGLGLTKGFFQKLGCVVV